MNKKIEKIYNKEFRCILFKTEIFKNNTITEKVIYKMKIVKLRNKTNSNIY